MEHALWHDWLRCFLVKLCQTCPRQTARSADCSDVHAASDLESEHAANSLPQKLAGSIWFHYKRWNLPNAWTRNVACSVPELGTSCMEVKTCTRTESQGFGLEKPQRDMSLKQSKYRCVWRAMCRKQCKYRVSWRNLQKTSNVSCFLRFLLKSIGIYGVFWSLNAENCVNSMVLERFWTPGKQKLLVFTWFCEPNAWTTLVCAWFSRVFSCAFINFLNQLTGPCILTKRYPRNACAVIWFFLGPSTLAASPVCEACQQLRIACPGAGHAADPPHGVFWKSP